MNKDADTVIVKDIILIGPMQAGKSTIGRLLAESLNLKQASLDAHFWRYAKEAGYDPARAKAIKEMKGPLRSHLYITRYKLNAVARHLSEHQGCVIGFGAGHSVYWKKRELVQIQQMLKRYINVFLLLPSPDMEESSQILRERTEWIEWLNELRARYRLDLNDKFLRHASNYLLAKKTFYTKDRSPTETCEEILAYLDGW